MLWWTKQLLRSNNPRTRRAAVQKIASWEGGGSAEDLLPLMQDPDVPVRTAVAEALGKTRDDRVLPTLGKALHDQAPEVREAAATAFATLKDPRATPYLIPAMADSNVRIRWIAGRTLDGLGWQPKNETEAFRFLVSQGFYSRAAAMDACAVDPLLEALRDRESPQRRTIVEALGQVGDARVIRALIATLKDPDPHVRTAVVEALDGIHDTRATEALIQALKDAAHFVRAATAAVLGRRRPGPPRGRPGGGRPHGSPPRPPLGSAPGCRGSPGPSARPAHRGRPGATLDRLRQRRPRIGREGAGDDR